MATLDPSFLLNIINNTEIFGITWIIPTVIVIFSVVMITRDMEDMKSLFLPVMVGYNIIGVEQSLLFIIIAGFIFIQQGLSLDIAGLLVQGVQSGIDFSRLPFQEKTRKRIEMKDFYDTRKKKKKYTKAVSDYTKDLFGVGRIGNTKQKVSFKDVIPFGITKEEEKEYDRLNDYKRIFNL